MSHRVEKDVVVPTRDGHTLATDVWTPDGGPAPALLVRTPYSKDVPNQLANAVNVPRLVEAEYAVVWQDACGTGRSGGVNSPLRQLPVERRSRPRTLSFLVSGLGGLTAKSKATTESP